MNNPNTLPLIAATHLDSDNSLVFVKLGHEGYWPAEALGITDPDLTAEKWNTAHGITPAQAEAMKAGSMWGWHTKAANPDNYDAAGKLKPSDKWVH